MNKTNHLEKILKFTCSDGCGAIYQLLEIHQRIKENCLVNCLQTWEKLLQDYYQDKIIAELARQEKETSDYE